MTRDDQRRVVAALVAAFAADADLLLSARRSLAIDEVAMIRDMSDADLISTLLDGGFPDINEYDPKEVADLLVVTYINDPDGTDVYQQIIDDINDVVPPSVHMNSEGTE